MDQVVYRVLRFDHFVLDLSRGCLRAGDQEIDLRPKTFEVLCCLAVIGNVVPRLINRHSRRSHPLQIG